MCDHPSKNASSENPHRELADSQADSQTAACGSRRRRLWELPAAAHCPVVGVCIPLESLRKLLRKSVPPKQILSDYVFHVGAVGECDRRNPISETLQKYLERRFALVVREFHQAKSTDALCALWIDAVNSGDTSGPFWAALTHPCCTPEVEKGLIQDMHMLQHQAGASVRADLKKAGMLEHRNIELLASLSEYQERAARQNAEKNEQIGGLQQQLNQTRSDIAARDNKISILTVQLRTVMTMLPETEGNIGHQEDLRKYRDREQEYEKKIRELERKLERTSLQADRSHTASMSLPADASAHCQSTNAGPAGSVEKSLKLVDRTILCVGGRTGNVPRYRQIIENAGAQFAYHDGGIENNESLLDLGLAAADMVICQTGCISHNAYWRVKEFCKRTGKRCVYVDNPSKSSLLRKLQQVSDEVTD